MQTLNNFSLLTTHYKALQDLKKLLNESLKIYKLIVFGSVVRNEADNESDLDLLVITEEPFSRLERHMITDRVFEINLKYGTNISSTVVDKYSWEKGYFTILPFKDEVEKEGVIV